MNQDQSERKNMEAPSTNPHAKIGIIETEKELYADKAASGACQIVKDICIDEGLALEKIFLETTEATRKSTFGFKPSAINKNDDLSGQPAECAAHVMQDLKITSIVVKDSQDRNSSCSLFELGDKLKADAQITRDIPDQKISYRPLLPIGDRDRDSQQSDKIKFDFSSDHKLHIYQRNAGQMNFDAICSTTEESPISTADSNKTSELVKDHSNVISLGTLKDGCSTAEVELSDLTESNKSRRIRENACCSEKEGGKITSNFNSGVVATKESQESSDNTDSEPFIDAENHFASEETVLDGVTSSSQSSFYHNNHGDLNSSGPFYLSGSKTSSGHIAFSGSISLRSDSSTTSTRSFAFPILQSEWNTSPVKMAKADHRHARKHQRWRTGIFCCKF